MKKLVDVLLKRYQTASYELQRKAFTFLVICVLVIVLIGSVLAVELLFALPWSVILPLVLAFALVLILFVVFLCGYYSLSSSLFFGLMFVTITYTILADFYDNAFDIYRYTLAATMMILVTGAVSMKRRYVLIMTIAGEVGIAFFFWYRYVLQLQNPGNQLAIISTVVAGFFYLFFGGMAYLTLTQGRQFSSYAVAQRDQALAERDRSLRMLDILSLYTKPSLISRVIDGTNPASIIPERRRLSILFCDLRGFTGLSENLEPRRIIELLNPYFTEMTAQIMNHAGEVDKLIGDGIMAIFNEPVQAVQAALAMRQALEDRNLDSALELYNGIGIHHGEVVAGNLGSPWKMDNTVIGEAVNIASRLEGLTKTYKASVIVSELVYTQCQNQDQFLLLDKILVKGSSVPVKIYGYFDSFSRYDAYAVRTHRTALLAAFDLYMAGDFGAAASAYAGIIKKIRLDLSYRNTYLNLMRSRCVRLEQRKASGGLADWQGIHSFND